MAKVEMDLAELKQLEAIIENLENKVARKEKEKQEILDKQPMVTVLHKYFKPSYKLKKEVDRITKLYKVDFSPYYTYSGGSRDVCAEELLYLMDITLSETDKIEKDYKGMSEVVSDIRAEEELKVKEFLDKALERATKAEYQTSVIKDEYEKKILKLNKSFDSKVEKIVEDYDYKLNGKRRRIQ